MRGRIPVDNLKLLAWICISVAYVRVQTLWPAPTKASRIIRRPLVIGGCGVTKPSLKSNPSFSGALLFAFPSHVARARVCRSNSDLHGMGTTSGSRNHGFVDSNAEATSFKDAIEVPMIPTEEA